MKDLGVLLAPGAGADRDQSTLVALDRVFTALGATVARMDFPYRQAGRRAPDRAPVLIDAVRREAAALAGRRLVLGGRSMGGRMCSMAVAEGLAGGAGGAGGAGAPAVGSPGAAGEGAAGGTSGPVVAGLLLVSYPLHPPGKPDSLRTEHFPAIQVPCLFISGTHDAFGTPAEMEAATAAVGGPVTHEWIEGKDHGLKGVDALICELATAWASTL